MEPEPEPQAAEPQPKEPEPVEPEPVEPGSQLEESLPAEPELDLTDEEKAPQPEEPLPTNGMPVPVPVTESDDATAGPAVAAQISKAHGKFDLKRIILIATGIFVPPAALVLFWVWKRPKSKVPRIVLTLLLAVYALLWCGGFVSSCSASMEQSRLESLVQADANLDATYEGDGVTIHYPSSWTQFDAGNWGVAYASQTGNRFEYGEAKSVWPALDAAKYNLKYEHGFEQLVSDLTTNLKASTRGMTLDKTSIDVRDNVMVAKTPFVVSDGSSNSCDGTLVVYCDGDGKLGCVEVTRWVKEGNAFFEEDGQTVDNIVDALEFTGSKFAKDPSKDPVTELAVTYDGKTDEGVMLDASNAGIRVSATFEDGSCQDITSGWKVENPAALVAGQDTTVHITYLEGAADLTVHCTTSPITGITASYDGNTEEGATLDAKNAGIKVVATHEDGSTTGISSGEWSLDTPATLAAGQTATVHIAYGDFSTDLSVECTTLTPEQKAQQYKDGAENISYSDLLRNPGDYVGHTIHEQGKVMQALSDGFLVEVTNKGYGIWDDIVVVAWDGEPNVIEKDVVDIWGTYTGSYTYTTAIGAQKTVPSMAAEYVNIN